MRFDFITPRRIETSRLVIRKWEPRDAAMLVEAITDNLDHLRPWMPWAMHEPQSVEVKASRIAAWNEIFLRGRQFWYGLFSHDECKVIGGVGLHRDLGDGAASIGYWVRHDITNRGFASDAAAAMTRVGFEIHGNRRLEIHCDPANAPSAAVARKLGYCMRLVIPRCVRTPTAEPRDSAIWAMSRTEFEQSPARELASHVAFGHVQSLFSTTV